MTIERYTTNYSFRIIDYATRGWHDDEHANWDALDGVLSGVGTPLPFAEATGTGDAALLAYSPAIGAYVSGLQLTYKAAGVNSGPATINVNGLGAKSLRINGAELPANFITSGSFVKVVYDGTNFAVVVPALTLPANSIINGDSDASVSVDADDFFVENSVGAGISVLTPATSVGSFNFSSTLGTQRGSVKYDHSIDALQFYQSGSKVVEWKGGYQTNVNNVYVDVCTMFSNTSTTIFSASSPFRSVFSTENVDTASAYDLPTGVFTVPAGAGGHYDITYKLYSDTGPSGDFLANGGIVIAKNGTAVTGKHSRIASGVGASVVIQTIQLLAAGDTIDVRCVTAALSVVNAYGEHRLTIKRLA